MSQADLNALEREVEQTRARFANDLARLRSPHNLAAFKEDLWAQARETRDEMIDKTKEAASDAAQRILAELKARAAANPAAALALGAGLAWRLVHRPPIATVLVGVGLIGLLRTSPSQTNLQTHMDPYAEDAKPHDRGGAGLASQASALADAARRKVLDWGAQASDAARELTTQIVREAASAAERTSDALHDAGHTVSESVARVGDDAASVSDRVSSRLHAAVPGRDDRDTYLLGAAALAVTAAVGIAFQRRAQEDTRLPKERHPLS
jgi:gas vesicle protein